VKKLEPSDLRIIDSQIEDGVLAKVNGNLPDVRCGMIVCGDMRHRADIQGFFGHRLSPNIHPIMVPGGAIEFSPRSPRNKRYPGDFDARMRDIARAIVAQSLRHILLIAHYECGDAILDGLDLLAAELLVKDAKQAIIWQFANNAIALRTAVNGADLWKPGEQDISGYLHCFTDGLPFTKHIRQERTVWFLTNKVPNWIAQHYPKTATQLLE